AIRPPLPKFDAIGLDAEPSPVVRPRDLRRVRIVRLDLVEMLLEPGAVRDRLALWRGEGSNLAAARPGVKVLVRFFRWKLVRDAGPTDLTLEGWPVEQHLDVRIGRDLPPLLAFVVGEEDDAPFVEALHEDGPGRRATVRPHGRDDHGVRLDDVRGRASLVEPSLELLDWVVERFMVTEVIQLVGHAHRRNVLRHSTTSLWSSRCRLQEGENRSRDLLPDVILREISRIKRL